MLKILRHIIEEVYALGSPREALFVLVTRLREALNTDACSLFVLDHRNARYVLMATDGLNNDIVGKITVNMDQGLVGLVGSREELLNLDDAPSHPHYYYLPGSQEEKFHAFLGVPIIYRRRLLGVLMVQQAEKRKFDEEEEAFLATVAIQLAPLVARVKIHQTTAQRYRRDDEPTYQGLPSARGVGLGHAVVIYPLADLYAVPDRLTENVEEEIIAFEQAIEAVREEVRNLRERMSASLPPAEQILFDAYLGILDSNSLGGEITEKIRSGYAAQTALRYVIQKRVRQFEKMEDEYLRERGTDIKDLGNRILASLQLLQHEKREYPEKTILVGQALTAADLLLVPREQLAAIISLEGSVNAHVAILAKALGIPAVMGAHEISLADIDGKLLIVDGYYGDIFIDPSSSLIEEFTRFAEQEKALDERLLSLRDLPAETSDGIRVNMWVNAGLESDGDAPFQVGADGVGLYRTEVPFMLRERFPTEQEQYLLYKQLLTAFSPKPVTMRTLDIGGDKSLPYFSIDEENPYLGWRGIRVSLDQPDLFITQIRAMLRANNGLNNLQIMFPMVSHIAEFEDACHLVRDVHHELQADDPAIVLPPLGVMIEVPSAVYQAKELARRADFFSIGTNDLAQYMLAVDRNNNRVASLYDSLHPAVLTAVRQVIRAAHRAGKPVSICGEMSSDPVAALLLLGMNIDSLSCNSNSLSRVKWVIRRFSFKQAKQLLHDVAQMESADEIRSHIELALERAGLGALIRAE